MEGEHCPYIRLILRERFHKDFMKSKNDNRISFIKALPWAPGWLSR